LSAVPGYTVHRDHINQALATQAPPDLLSGLRSAAQRLDAIDFAAAAPRVGEPAPNFSLPDSGGDRVRLSALLRGGPVVLIFYRGAWCPYCNLQLRTFQSWLPRFERYGARLVAVSPQTPDHSLSMAEKNDLGFSVLSDEGAVVIAAYGLTYAVDDETRNLLETAGNDIGAYNGETGWVLPAPATFVIDAGGQVRYAHVRGDWTERAEPSEVLSVLAGLG
jgi:peroxiredoxin